MLWMIYSMAFYIRSMWYERIRLSSCQRWDQQQRQQQNVCENKMKSVLEFQETSGTLLVHGSRIFDLEIQRKLTFWFHHRILNGSTNKLLSYIFLRKKFAERRWTGFACTDSSESGRLCYRQGRQQNQGDPWRKYYCTHIPHSKLLLCNKMDELICERQAIRHRRCYGQLLLKKWYQLEHVIFVII